MKVIAILGATATGKSALAMQLADALGGEIVNADALQVYRDLDIGTAKPTPAERQRVRHHLIDILCPTEPYSAGEFARRAEQAAEEITARGAVPLIVGGSGLYLRALFEGLADLPSIPEAVREGLKQELVGAGLPALRKELERVDAETAARLAPGDTQRTLRALEVYRTSQRPLSDWLRQESRRKVALDPVKIGLTLPRKLLYDKISVRARAMMASGWAQEVRSLMAKYPLEAPAFQAIGYRELCRALAAARSPSDPLGQNPSNEDIGIVVDQILVATRRYAKRQETWFRREPGIRWLNALEIEPAFDELVNTLKSHVIRSGGQ